MDKFVNKFTATLSPINAGISLR